MIDPGLEGRVALVTGANHGIGAATARALGRQGAAVLCTYLRDYQRTRSADPGTPPEFHALRAATADGVVDALRSEGGRAVSLEADLSEPSSIAQVFDHAEQELGAVEILVLNAAASEVDSFRDVADDRFGRSMQVVTAASHDHHFAVNSRANALLIAEFARRHRDRGASWGRIVGVTSAGSDGFPGEISYGASKAAFESYVKSAAWELGSLGIRANLVKPPATDTGWLTEETKEIARNDSPLRHVATADEIAEVIVFLLSEQARWVTGQRLTVY